MTNTAAQPSDSADQTTTDQAVGPLFASVEAWVTGYFAPMFLHRIPGNTRQRWCPRWWDHAEAIVRLRVLWSTWEAARNEPAAKPGWWLDLDHHLPILTSLDGPFRNCRHADGPRAGKHEPETVIDLEPVPPGWLD